ncbi:MAG: hypothetical protein ACR2PH_16515 [Desulfobulbia bacterium]
MKSVIEIALDFIEKHGFGDISIDAFDIFIIDAELAQDPKTSDTTTLEYKGFVQERSAARASINSAATRLDNVDQLFQIRVVDAGQTYTVEPYGENKTLNAVQIARRLETFTRNKKDTLLRDNREIERLIKIHGDDLKLVDAKEQLLIVSKEAENFLPKVLGVMAQMEKAYLLASQNAHDVKRDYETEE